MHDFDRTTGVIFYSQVGINGLACWNPNSQHTPHNFDLLAKDNRTMIYPTDVNVSEIIFNEFKPFSYSVIKIKHRKTIYKFNCIFAQKQSG